MTIKFMKNMILFEKYDFFMKTQFFKLPKTHMHTDINKHTIQRKQSDLSTLVMQFDGCFYMQESSSSIVVVSW